MKKPFLSIAVVLLILTAGNAQKKYTNPDRANALKDKYDDAQVIGLTSNSHYVFKLDDEQLKVINNDDITLITLRSSVKYARSIFYDENINILNSTARYASGKGSLRSTKVCGNYEVENIFYSDAKVCTYYVDILDEASEVAFSFERIYNDPKYLTKVFFHDQNPSEQREISFEIPDAVDVELQELNFAGFEIEKREENVEGGKKYTYTAKNIDKLQSEDNSLGHLHHYPHILVLTKSFTTSSGQQTVLSSVDDLYSWYASLVDKVEVDRSAFKSVVDQLTGDAASDEEKIRNIYYWVQENIKYIAFEDGIAAFKPEAPQDVYTNRYGDCKGMAILTKEMLSEAGFDARLAWIGTNKIPYNYDLPSFAVDNHMICTLDHNDQLYVMDPTEKFIALGKHGERIQGKEMLIENGDQYLRKEVPIGGHVENLVSRTEHLKIDGNQLIGDGKLNIEGESKKMILYYSSNSKMEDQKDYFDYLSVAEYNNDDKVEVANISRANRDQPLELTYNFQLNNKVSSFGSDLYMEFDWEKTYSTLQMDNERISDYYFGRKICNKVKKVIEIPEGYKVTHLPNPVAESYKDISIKIDFEQDDHAITYFSEVVIGSGIIEKDDFDVWNGLVKKLKEVYNDQIVITKI